MNNYMDFLNIAGNIEGYFVASLTDEYLVGRWPAEKAKLEGKYAKILEVRVFNEDKEAKIFRSDIGRDFSETRVIDDKCIPAGTDIIVQEQFLDIDEKRSKAESGTVIATGGGRYSLPIANLHDAKVIIKYYLKPDEESGVARLVDWRVAGFKEEVEHD